MFSNVTLDENATIELAGEKTSAKDIVCENKEVVFVTLEGVKALVQNGFARAIVSLVVNLLEHIIEKLCTPKASE